MRSWLYFLLPMISPLYITSVVLSHDCRSLMQKLQVETVKDIYHEGNACADRWAAEGLHSGVGLPVFCKRPNCITNLLMDNAQGVFHPHFVRTLKRGKPNA
ncbi:hypothetical protein RHSIM_Rhsim04G0093200 [Rhododendron simsii]|uniref:RNase H type-1 domain-containing protein n=1 Tax=Rhododendron simsii TaxID=118357 RepID=A0A834LRU5_RHOSS|nr:hypothetical protein RHSIM_Rhsim04G0093200 [Rhododendron simsii]